MFKEKENKMLTTRDITLIAILTAILFVQEQVLSFIPNFQLTVFLLVLFSKKIGFVNTIIITAIHVLLDNLVMGSFNFIYVPFMLIGWLIIPVLLNTVFKKVNSNILLAVLGVMFSFIYCWIYIIPNCIILQTDFFSYLIADLMWEILLASSSFITILLLYDIMN
jgi:hypothetical protein